MIHRKAIPFSNILYMFIFLLSFSGSGTVWSQETYWNIIKMKDPSGKAVAITQLESRLRESGKIVSCKGMGEGNYESLLLTYDDGTRAIFKVNDPREEDPYALYQHEIVAYQLARMFQIDNVPPTVELNLPATVTNNPLVRTGTCEKVFRRMEKYGKPVVGSAQYFVEGAQNAPVYNPRYNKGKNLQFFDYLIFNCDRPGTKNLVFREGYPFFIDNGLAFLSKENLDLIHQNPEHATFCDYLTKIEKKPELACEFVDEDKLSILRDGDFSFLDHWVSNEGIKAFQERVASIISLCDKKNTLAVESEDLINVCHGPALSTIDIGHHLKNLKFEEHKVETNKETKKDPKKKEKSIVTFFKKIFK